MGLKSVIQEEIDKYAGPVLIYDTASIRANMEELVEAFGGEADRVLFPVKSFPALPILLQAWKVGMGFEVSTEREYHLLPKPLDGRTVSLTSPLGVYSDRFLEFGNRLQVQIDTPPGCRNGAQRARCQFGFRLNHQLLPIKSSLWAASDRPSRFGVSWETFLDSAPLFRDGILSGVHLHNGSEANTPSFYPAALNVILKAAKDLRIPLRYVNIGGGFHPIPQPKLVQLLNELQQMAGEMPIYIEPGNVLCRNAGYLLCKAHSVRPFGTQRYYITLDASYDCHARWSRPSWDGPDGLQIIKMPYQKIPAAEPGFQFIIFSGATCYEKDQLGIFRVAQNGSAPPVAPGDHILLSNINGYSFAWNTEFNGVAKASVRFV